MAQTPVRTPSRELEFRGVGVHSGRPVRLLLRPSEAGAIVFRRVDLGGAEIPVDARSASSGNRTVLEAGGARVETVEHLLAALAAFGVGSVVIELDAPEVPILDGSALPFARALSDAGLRDLPIAAEPLPVREPFRVEAAGASLEASPHPGLRIDYTIVFAHPAIGTQRLAVDVTAGSFLAEIAPARTFGFLKDAEAIRARGLAGGSSLENTVVLDDAGPVNGPLRFPDEFVRHKILDLAGDLGLLGRPVAGLFRAVRGGHDLHLRAVRRLLDLS